MSPQEFERLCLGLPEAALVRQWGDSHVFKVAGKVFAIGAFQGQEPPSCALKTTELSFHMLTEAGLARRAPYLPRGNWLSLRLDALEDGELDRYVRGSYQLVAPKALKGRAFEGG